MGDNECGDAFSSDAQDGNNGTARSKLREAGGYLERIGASLQRTDRAVASLESFIDEIDLSVTRLRLRLDELSQSNSSRTVRVQESPLLLGSEHGSDQQVSQQPASGTESQQDSVEQRQPSPDVRRVVPKDQKRGFHLGR